MRTVLSVRTFWRGRALPVAVVSLNIHAGVDEYGAASIREQSSALAALDPDVVLLQEVDERTARSGRISQLHTISEAVGLPFTAFGPSTVHDGGLYGNAILSRYALSGAVRVPYTPVPSAARRHLDGKVRGWPEKLEQRSAVIANATLSGVRTTLVATHLSLFPEERAVAVGELMGLMTSGPVVLGADLNVDGRDDPELGALMAGLEDLSLGPAGRPHATYPASGPRFAIDAVLGRGWRQSSASTVHHVGSDHLALRVELEPVTAEQ